MALRMHVAALRPDDRESKAGIPLRLPTIPTPHARRLEDVLMAMNNSGYDPATARLKRRRRNSHEDTRQGVIDTEGKTALTGREVERLIEAARKHGRYGHRDATMILLTYRHGLRASELCDLQWHQVEINTGRLHVRRSKKGTPSVHPMQGDEIRALRRLAARAGGIAVCVHQ